MGFDYSKGNSEVNQRIKSKFVEREVYTCVSTITEYILQKSFEDSDAPFSWDDITNRYPDNDEEIDELQEKYDALETDRLTELDDQEEAEIEESKELLDEEKISDFTHNRNLDVIEEKYQMLKAEVEKEMEEIEERIEELRSKEKEPPEIYEWWIVSSFLCRKLKEYGESVISHENIWGRHTTGQAILLDWIITQICAGMEILEGQKYQWEV